MIKRKSAKPLIIILTVLTAVSILSIGTIIVLQSIWDFIGINRTNKISIDAACAITYVNTKYGAENANRLIFITFVAICLAFVLTALLLAFFIMFVCYYFLDKQKSQEEYLAVVTQFKIYAIYVILWWDLLSVAVNVGYFLSFYLQIPTTCNGTVQLQLQQIIIFALSGVALILLILVWVLLICMKSHIHQYLTDNQIVAEPQKIIRHKSTEKPLITDIQMQEKAHLAQARKNIQSNNLRNGSFNRYFQGNNQNLRTSQKYLSPQQKKSILLEVQKQQKRDEKHQLRSTLLDKYNRDSPKNKSTKNQFYYGNFKQLNQRKISPRKEQENLVFHKPRFDHPQTPSKNEKEHQGEDQHNNSKGKLQTSYFREPTLKNRRYDSPQLPNQRENKLFKKQIQPVQQGYYDKSKRSTLYFENNRSGSKYSPIHQQRQRSSPKNQTYARKIDFEQREKQPIHRQHKYQRTSNNKGREVSQKQRKGMLIDYIRNRYVD